MSCLARWSRRYHEVGLLRERSGARAGPSKSDAAMIGFGSDYGLLAASRFSTPLRCDDRRAIQWWGWRLPAAAQRQEKGYLILSDLRPNRSKGRLGTR